MDKKICPFYQTEGARCVLIRDMHIRRFERCGDEPCQVTSPVTVERGG